MLHAILTLRDFIQDHNVIVGVVAIPTLIIYSFKLWQALFTSPNRNRASNSALRRPPPKPGLRPQVASGGVKPPEPPRSTSDQDVSGYQRAGAAKTVKLPSVPPKADGATPAASAPAASTSSPAPSAERIEVKTGPGHDTTAIKLPAQDAAAGSAAPAPVQVPESKTGLIRKATRMEELGFHPGTNPGGEGAPAASTATSGASGAAAASPAGTSEVPRSQTAELTSILERIDKFLADDQPAGGPPAAKPPAEAAPAAAKPAETAREARDASAAPTPAPSSGEPALAKKVPPLWARPDAQDEDAEAPGAAGARAPAKPGEPPAEPPQDGSQQRLF